MLIALIMVGMISMGTCQGATVQIAVGNTPLAVTTSALLSFTIEISQMYIPSRLCNFSDPVLLNLARSLEPEIIRFGGTRGDSFYYQLLPNQPQLATPPPGYQAIITPELLGPVFQFASAVNAKLLYGANAGLGPRLGNATEPPSHFITDPGQWMPDNFNVLAQYCLQKNCPIAGWEFGNEPNLFPSKFNFYLSPFQYATDLRNFCAIVHQYPNWTCLASDVDYAPFVDGVQDFDVEYLPRAGSVVDHVTYHFYPLIGDSHGPLPIEERPWLAQPWKILDPYYLNQVSKLADRLFPFYKKYAPQASIILGETSSAVNGGQVGLSDRYVDSIEWMDKLGALAGKGISVIARQTLCRTQSDSSFNYALINVTQPRPSYYPAVFFKRLMAATVLPVNVTPGSLRIRPYAFCSKRFSGGVVFLIVNIHGREKVQVQLGSELGDLQTAFVFSAEALDSDFLSVNDKVIVVNPDGSFPNLSDFAQTLATSTPLVIPSAAYAFIELPNASHPSCP